MLFHFHPISDMSITKLDEYRPVAQIRVRLSRGSAAEVERRLTEGLDFRLILGHRETHWPDTVPELAPNLLKGESGFPSLSMENILKDMNDLPGVRGSFICDGDGTVISTAMPDAYSSQIGHAGREVVQVIALLHMLGEETDVVDFLFSDGRILVNGFKDFSLIVFCEPDTDIAMVRLESNVTLGEIRRDGRFKRHMQKVSKSRRDLVGGKGLAESYQQIIKKLKSSGR